MRNLILGTIILFFSSVEALATSDISALEIASEVIVETSSAERTSRHSIEATLRARPGSCSLKEGVITDIHKKEFAD